MSIAIEPGDVLSRAGVQFGGDRLAGFIGEPYNHSGLAISPFSVHHVESNGYETVSVDTFFSCSNSKRGALLRFVGPLGPRIRKRAAEIAVRGRYPRIKGNPFSTANDSFTTNCNEFVYSLFQLAIAELLRETEVKEPTTFQILTTNYAKQALIKARRIRQTGFGWLPGWVAFAAQEAAKSTVDHPDVKPGFEGEIACLKPAGWFCFRSEAVLDTYTPNSFIESPFFRVVDTMGCR